MKYNDNFVLPPENILKKMREDYKVMSAKTTTLQQNKVKKQQVAILPQNAFNNFYRGNFYREQLRNRTNNRYTRQRLQRLMDRTDRDIDRFSLLYGGLERAFIPPRIGVSRGYCQLLREAIIAEVDIISQLFELIQEGQIDTEQITLYEIILERLEVLRELTDLLSGCGTRRF